MPVISCAVNLHRLSAPPGMRPIARPANRHRRAPALWLFVSQASQAVLNKDSLRQKTATGIVNCCDSLFVRP
jgi:hypothetical protein